jgi:hypothetical protein
MDENVKRAVTDGLVRRGIDVVRAQDDGHAQLPDRLVFDRATQLDRILISQDEDMLVEAASRQRALLDFAGLVYARQREVSVRQCVDDLELIALAMSPAELRARVIHLPLK